MLVFPNRCLACGASPETTRSIQAEWRIEFLVFCFFRWIDILVPVCKQCGRRRMVMSAAGYVGLVALGMGLFMTALALWGKLPAPFNQAHGPKWIGIAPCAAAIYMLWFTRNRLDQSLDYRILGIRATRLVPKTRVVTIEIRDSALAQEIVALSGIDTIIE